jgi:hypothetical protein
MESLNLTRGWAFFKYASPFTVPGSSVTVSLSAVSDLALVGCVDAQTSVSTPLGFAYRPSLAPITSTTNPFSGAAYPTVLLENMAHINYGHGMDNDVKSFAGLTINGAVPHAHWNVWPLPMRYEDGWPAKLAWGSTPQLPPNMVPAFFKGSLVIAGAPTDTYLSTRGW